jgi:hypothetical protein
MRPKRLNTDTLTITPEILGLIAGIDEFKGAWRALGAIAPERLQALRKVATIESVGSSSRSSSWCFSQSIPSKTATDGFPAF